MTNTEKLNCLTDRPCTVCKYHKENGCSKWSCVFEQEPTTKNDLGVDCISRQAVIKILVEAKEFGSWDDSSQINRLDAIDNVDMLPSVTPQEPKTGHWIMTGDYYTGAYGTIDYVECSCCHEDSLEEGNYCPNCGCRMFEPQESEDKE